MTQGKYQHLYEELEENTLYTHRTLVYRHTWKDSRSKQLALKAANQNALKFKKLQILPDGKIDGVDAWTGANWYLANHDWLNRNRQNGNSILKPKSRVPQKISARARIKNYVSMAAVFILVVTGGFVLSSYRANKIDRLVRAGDEPGLRAMLRDQSNSEVDRQIREGIAKVRHRDGYQIFPHIKETRAIFAFEKDPMVLIGDKVIQIGDHVTIDMATGWVSEIKPNHLTIEGPYGAQTVWFPRMVLLGYPFNRNFPVTLYERPGNAQKILEAVAQMTGRHLDGELDAAMVGHVEADDYESFLSAVAPYLIVNVDNESITVLPTLRVRGYIGWTRYYRKPNFTRMSKILNDMGNLLGYQVDVEGEDGTILVPNRQMQDICEDLSLSIAVNNRERYIEVHSENDGTE
jgi:hypothetical protein